MKKPILLFFIFIPVLLFAQSSDSKLISISIFNNATLLPPESMTAMFNQPVHPGGTVAYEFGWKETKMHKWFQNVGISYFYHRYVYQALMLNTQAGYRRKINRLTIEGYMQLGYMHAFLLTDRAVFQSDGTYVVRQGFGKPQFITGAGIGLGYNLGGDKRIRRIFLNFDFRVQMPFVKSYVPLLPNGALSLGMQFNIK